MSDNAVSLYQTEYNGNIHARYQQTKPRLSEFVEWDEFNGERKDYPLISSVDSSALTVPTNYNGATNDAATRFPTTPIVQAQFDKRWLYTGMKFAVKHFNQWDEKLLGKIALPGSSVQREHMYAFSRDSDDVVWGAAIATAKEGQLGTTDAPLPSGQKIAHGGTGMTLAKLLATLDILDTADAMDDGEPQRVFCWTVKQRSELLNTTEVKSADYNTVKALAEGKIDTFMGFKFKLIKRLPYTAGTPNVRKCIAWQKGAVVATKFRKPTTMTVRDDLHNALQIYDSWLLGGVRVQDAGVVEISVVE